MDKRIFLFGIFVMAAVVLVSPVEAGLHTYTFENTTLGVKVIVKALAPLNVTITPIADPTAIDPNRDGTWGGLNKFFRLDADKAFDSAEVRVKYNSNQLKGYVSEGSLQLKFWDSAINDWQVPLSTGVNKKKNYVWAKVSHFSDFAPIGDSINQYSNNFELPRASKVNVPLGTYLKNTFETFNADDLADAPYNVFSGEQVFGGLHSLKFNASIMHPEVFSPDTWIETGLFPVTGGQQYTFTFYTKYLPAPNSNDFGVVYYYELDAGNNFLGQTGDLFQFNATEAVSIRDYVTVTSSSAANGWLKVSATITPDPSATQAKIAFMQANLNNVGQDNYYVDDFSF